MAFDQIRHLEHELFTLKAENIALKQNLAQALAKIAVLESENANLHFQLQQIQAEQTIQGDTCPFCHHPKGELLKLVPHNIFGEVGVQVGFYKCANCGKEYNKEMPFGNR